MPNKFLLDLSSFSSVPQGRTLQNVRDALARSGRVQAIFLGGSLANGDSDSFSDIDISVFIDPDEDGETTLGIETMLNESVIEIHEFVGHNASTLIFWFENGIMCELYIFSTDEYFQRARTMEQRQTYECLYLRDSSYLEGIDSNSKGAHEIIFSSPEIDSIRNLIYFFWRESFNATKLIHRNHTLTAYQKRQVLEGTFIRLAFIEKTGKEYLPENVNKSTHTYLRAFDKLSDAEKIKILDVVGLEGRDANSLGHSIYAISKAFWEVGKSLNESYPFDYPVALAELTLNQWRSLLGLIKAH